MACGLTWISIASAQRLLQRDAKWAALSSEGQEVDRIRTNMVTAPGADGRLVTTRGRAVTVWRREPDRQLDQLPGALARPLRAGKKRLRSIHRSHGFGRLRG